MSDKKGRHSKKNSNSSNRKKAHNKRNINVNANDNLNGSRLKSKKFLTYLCISVLLAIVLVIGISLSKYVSEANSIHDQVATTFCFESDLAYVDSKTYTIRYWNGLEYDVEFFVRNYTNDLLKADEDLEYTINATVSGNATISLETASGGNVDFGTTISTLLSDDLNKDEYILKIIPTSDLGLNQTVTVDFKINSTKPYEKGLTASIVLTYEEQDSYSVNLAKADNGEYEVLTLQINETLDDDIVIKYDNTKLMLDTSSVITSGKEIITDGSISSFTISSSELTAGNSYKIYFIKLDDTEIVLDTDIIVN